MKTFVFSKIFLLIYFGQFILINLWKSKFEEKNKDKINLVYIENLTNLGISSLF